MKKQFVFITTTLLLLSFLPMEVTAQWSTTGAYNTATVTTGGNVGIKGNVGIESNVTSGLLNITSNSDLVTFGRVSISFIPFSIGNTWFHLHHTRQNSIQFSHGTLPGAAPIMTLVNSGNVLINKTTQTNTIYKLDVAGRVRADGIVVNTTGADFVFEDTYKLRPLSEVETFIKENKHLPEVPSAEEMTTEGMNVGETNTILLQKIEELTLYLIDQDKKIKEQERKINELSDKLNKQ